MESAFGFGGFVGYLCGGYIAKLLGPAPLFWVVAGVVLVTVMSCCLLPESLSPQLRTDAVPWYKANSLYCINVLLGKPSATRPRPRWALVLLSLAFTLSFLSEMGVSAISTLFLRARPLSWDDAQIGVFNAANSAARSASGVLALPLLARVVTCERHEQWVAGITLLLYGGSIELVSVPNHSVMPILAAVVVSGIAIPVAFGFLRCAFSRSVDAREQGQMLAALAFLESICIVVGPLLFNTVYEHTATVELRGISWYIIAALNVVAAGLLIPVPALPPGANADSEAGRLLPEAASLQQHDAPQ